MSYTTIESRNFLEAAYYEILKGNESAYRDYYAILKNSSLPKKEHHERCQWLISAAGKRADNAFFYELYKGALKLDAVDYFDSYLLYLESNRLPWERFYAPRRKILKRAVDAIQELIDGEVDEMFIQMPPRVGKTSLCVFLMTWLMGKYPNSSNLYCAFSDTITTSFYGGVMEVLNDPDTYLWNEVFPGARIVHTNSKEETVNIDRNSRYATLTARSIGGTLNGACDCSGLLLADDLIGSIEEVLNPSRLLNTWAKVDNNLLTRAKMSAKILWIGTRWSLADPAGRRMDLLMNDPKYENRRYREILLPALDENDESNFDYEYGVGFSTEYFHERRASFEHNNDMASWLAQYMQRPIERQGAVFTVEGMRYFNGVLPNYAPDKIFMAVDPAFGGGDFVAGPVCVKYGDDIYVTDVIYDDREKDKTIPHLIDIVLKNNVHQIQFGVNKLSMAYKEEFERKLRELEPSHRISITTKADTSTSSKTNKIVSVAPNIRDSMLFLDSTVRSKEYNMFMQNVFGFTIYRAAKAHDDAPDSLAMAIDMDMNPWGAYRVINRPF